MTKRPSSKRGWVILLVWVLIAFFYFTVSWDYIRVNWNDRKFVDYMQYVANIVGDEQRPAADVRTLLEVKADELGLPIGPENIHVLGGGTSISISVDYEVDISVPVFERGVYKKVYQHKVLYQPTRR